MSSIIVKLALDAVVAVLLLVTILYCWALNRRIRILQDSKGELAKLIKHFDESTERASESIIALQTASKKIGETIQTRIDKAKYLVDDLSFMIDKGNKLADQMESGISSQRRQLSPPSRSAAPSRSAPPAAERPVPQPTMSRAKAVSSLESVLERMQGRTAAEPQQPGVPKKPVLTARPRSKAEQELLEAIKSGR
jgi:hypothetical protein